MSLTSEYKRQFAWRAWPNVFEALPLERGQLVLDFGCSVGDQAAELAARGARVIGIDINDELLGEARSREIDNARFLKSDLRTLPDLGSPADGLWCSFAAAYFTDFSAALSSWTKHLRPGGWIALTEVDDLFGHEPLSAEAKSILDAYARDALESKRYDFQMGRKLRPILERCGFSIARELRLPDQEFSFSGPARREVIDAWCARLDRMKLLRNFVGARYEELREEFLQCLASPDHRSTAAVFCCIGRRSSNH